MQTHPSDRLILRGILLVSLAVGLLTLLWALSPAPASMAQGQATPPPRDTPAPTRPAPGPGRGTLPPPTGPAVTPQPDQPGGTPVATPGALPLTGGGPSVDLTWLVAGAALIVLGSLFGLLWGQRSRTLPR